ncbi:MULTISPECIES: TerB family tellurite resistance protein [Alteromonas]|jgi:tellurite resistance protein|uniref:TerB family tellurite resistance protein n=1 Tax=Alteromonas TaxID=226 RepID=UPI00066EB2D5|nr:MULTISPECIES: TerB family tellurite resistance protein [Alteromonas]MEC7632773.1 TerB family tellurite resistance protein [Pseudomonadota bacterium]MDW5283400.1 TerB family tellurite resistance protein [Alteromonas macleodii]MEC8640107.1 TerB family tellurite resistance protein [Pseudomonadota bacterium]MED5326787.1 TerB family tellurite resistance protein [Pseudomonadota bacterium]MEE3027858.1 TerB family tellurite resistance protein [Pseudomonadota bacterium]
MQLSEQQSFNQALIKLSVLLYQVDGMVTLSEQDYLNAMVESLDWQSPICREAFLNDTIYQTRKAIDTGDARTFLRSLKHDLSFDAEKTLEVAMAITGVDGERSEEETELLSLLTHKLLAKALVSGKDTLQ